MLLASSIMEVANETASTPNFDSSITSFVERKLLFTRKIIADNNIIAPIVSIIWPVFIFYPFLCDFKVYNKRENILKLLFIS